MKKFNIIFFKIYHCTFFQSTWNCDTCQADLALIAGVTRTEAFVSDQIDYLSGPAYCEGNEDCIGFLDPYMMYAAEELAVVLETDYDRLCTEVYNLGCVEAKLK